MFVNKSQKAPKGYEFVGACGARVHACAPAFMKKSISKVLSSNIEQCVVLKACVL